MAKIIIIWIYSNIFLFKKCYIETRAIISAEIMVMKNAFCRK